MTIISRTLAVFILLAAALLIGCGGSANVKSTMPVYLSNGHTNAVFVQAKTTTESGRKLHMEMEQYEVDDSIFLGGAFNANGSGENRLRNGNADLNSATTLVGPAHADTSQKITQISAHANFTLVDTRHFQLGWAPHLSYLILDSNYRIPGKSLQIDMEKPGVGAQMNLGFLLTPKWSLNVAGKVTHFTSNTTNITHNVFIRFQPTTQLNVDLGRYVGTLDVDTDTGLRYEQRVKTNPGCSENCTYEYNGTSNSRLEIDSAGYRVGLGWHF